MSIRDTTGAPNSIVPADYGFEVYGPDGRWIGWGCDATRAAAVLYDLTGAQAKRAAPKPAKTSEVRTVTQPKADGS